MLSKYYIISSNIIHEAKQKIKTKVKNADGMEMLQMVIIIALAVAIAALFFVGINLYFGDPTDDESFWGKLRSKVEELFDTTG